MQALQQYKRPKMSRALYHQPMSDLKGYGLPQNQMSSDGTHFPIQTPFGKYCTSELSSMSGSNLAYNSPSTVNFSPDGSLGSHQEYQSNQADPIDESPKSASCVSDDANEDPIDESPKIASCVSDDANELRHKLHELEMAMFGPDADIFDYEDNVNLVSPKISSWRQMMEAIPKRDIKQVLILCAKAVSENDLLIAQWLMAELRQMVSVSGEPIQRLGAYMLEGLVARLASLGSLIYKPVSLIYKAFRCKEPARAELLSYMHILYEVCPYFKFGCMSANGAIAEAMKNENKVHIIDFQIGQGSQWVPLIQAFAGRPGGPPTIRITGVDDSTSAYARGGGLNIVGKRLSKLAKSYRVPFKFHGSAISGSEVQITDLAIKPGEALAVNFAFMLHHIADESVSTQNHRDRLLRLVKGLSPKVVTLVEQEANTNTAAFFPRFMEAMDYYTAMFESIEVTLPREDKERINVEQHCLARDVVNVIACEGMERVERHELLGKWKSRFRMAGFVPCSMSSLVNATIKTLLDKYSGRYRLEEKDGALYLGWMDRDLVACCAWK